MKFKSNIETQAGIEDSAASAGTAGQLLSSLGPVAGVDGVEWVDQSTIVAAAATLVEIECKNTSGSTITKGTPVYQTGNVGATAVIEIAEADALISANKGPAIGLLQDTLTNNAFGFVVIIGELLNLTTSPIDGVTPTVGDKIFVKSGGGLTTVKPTTSLNSIQAIGLIGKVSGGNAGSVTVSSTMRANDVPNLPEGRIWIGDGNTIVSDTVYVDEPNNRVGIGTTSPSTVLEVSSSGVNGVDISQSASNASQSGRLFFTTNTASEGFALFNANGTFQINSGGIPNDTSGNNRISIIGSSGNVGIGTTSPSEKLEVNGNIKFTSNGNQLRNSAGNNMLNDTSNLITIGNGATSTVYARGNVGIGTASPSAKLEIKTDNTTQIPLQITHNFFNDWIIQKRRTDSTQLMGLKGVNSNGGLGLATNNVVRMTVDSSGSVGIGTTSPNSKLEVGGEIDATTGDGYRIDGKPWASLESNTLFRLGDWDGEGFSTSIYGSNSSEVMRVTGNNVGIGTTSPGQKLEVNGTVKSNSILTGTNLSLSQSFGFNFINSGSGTTIRFGAPASYVQNVSVQGTLKADSSIQCGNNSNAASAALVGSQRYRTNGNNSYVDVCMQTGASTYTWVNIVTNNW